MEQETPKTVERKIIYGQNGNFFKEFCDSFEHKDAKYPMPLAECQKPSGNLPLASGAKCIEILILIDV